MKNSIKLILPVDQNVGTCLVKGSTCAPLQTSVLLQDPPQEPAKEQSGAAAADRTAKEQSGAASLRTLIYLVTFSLLAVTDLDTWLASSRTRAIIWSLLDLGAASDSVHS